MTILLLLLLFLLASYLLFLHLDLKGYYENLQEIIRLDTNQELKLQTRFSYLKKITLLNNQLIRQQKQARSTLKQETENLEKAIHNISHDLRTPLTVAGGYTQLLLGSSQGQYQEMLQKIKENLDAVNIHLEHLLEYQRLNENQLTLHLQQVNVSRLLEETLAALYPAFQEKELKMSVTISKDLTMISDTDALTRIFQNILGNLLDHGCGTGDIQLYQTEEALVFSCENQLHQEIHQPERLTDRFYTEDLARQNQNAGIGLFIVKELSEKLGGQLMITTTATTYQIKILFPRK